MLEIELKLELDGAQERRLRAAPALKELTEGRARTQTLVSVYYDTPDHALRADGIALRIRKAGRRWIQTVKQAAGPMEQGLSAPIEDECVVPGPDFVPDRIADDDLRERVIEAVREGVAPVVETRFRRTTRDLALPGGTKVELAIDVGEVIAGDRSQPLIEAELELKEGRPADLYTLAARLMETGPVRFSPVSKSERAVALLEGPPSPPAERRACKVAIAPGDTAEAAAAAILSETLAHYLPNVALVLETDNPEGPHQVRVALRRMRSALGAFRPVLGEAALRPWSDAARALGAEVGRLRDLDVLAGELVAAAAAEHPGEPGFAALTGAIRERRSAVLKDVRAHLASPEVTRWGFEFAAFLTGRGWLDHGDHGQTLRLAQPTGPFARKVLDKRWKGVARYGKRIAGLTIDERHEMRKELKKLRYMVEAFRGLYDTETVRAFNRLIKDLQTAFGALNDTAMAEELLGTDAAPGAGDIAATRAAGRVLGHLGAEAARLWPEAIEGWDRLAGARKFWR